MRASRQAKKRVPRAHCTSHITESPVSQATVCLHMRSGFAGCRVRVVCTPNTRLRSRSEHFVESASGASDALLPFELLRSAASRHMYLTYISLYIRIAAAYSCCTRSRSDIAAGMVLPCPLFCSRSNNVSGSVSFHRKSGFFPPPSPASNEMILRHKACANRGTDHL